MVGKFVRVWMCCVCSVQELCPVGGEGSGKGGREGGREVCGDI